MEYYKISNLEKTSLDLPSGKTTEVKVGDKVDFVTPNFYGCNEEKSLYQNVKKIVEDNIGKAPYEITGIVHLDKGPITNLWVQGENGKERVNKKYFTKYEN